MPRFDSSGRDRITPDPVLTQISVSFEAQASYIAPILMPTVRVSDQTARYEIFGREAFGLLLGDLARAPGARASEREGRKRFAEDSYFAVEYSEEELIPDEEKETNPGESPENDSVEALTNDLLIRQELKVRDMLYDPTPYHTGHVVTLGSGEHFDEYDTSDPVEVFRELFRTFHDTLGTVPNLGVIPWKTMSYLEDHPVVIERYALNGGIITPEQIATLIGLDRILVPGGKYNGENPGQAAALSQIWGNNIVMGLVPSSPQRDMPALGYKFLWPIPGGGRRTDDGIQVDRRRDGDRIGWINRVRTRYDHKLVGRDPDLEGSPLVSGMLIRNVLSPANA